MISEPVLCRSFVGREAELDHLAARRRAAAAGRGGAILISGEAGVGKSRLLAEFRGTLPRRTTRVAWAACREFAQRPLGPWLDVLRALDPNAAATLVANTFASKAEQTAALIETFEGLSARSTTIVLLEDLHWGDPDIAHVLLVLTERAATQRMLFVGTYRGDELRAGHPAFPLLGRLVRERATSLVKLPPFGAREMTKLLRAALPMEPLLPDGVLRDVRVRSEGNPLFGEELLRHAVDRYRYGDEGVLDPLPLSLDAIVRERLKHCDASDRDLLMRASLFGRSFDLDVVADAFETTAERCRPALERLADQQLIDPTDEATSTYRFRHALTRDVIYAEIPEERLAQLHLRVATAIEASGAPHRHVEALAHNYWLAGERKRAAPFCVAAGDAARTLHAYEDAAAWYERAAEAFDGECGTPRALVQAGLMRVFSDDVAGALDLYHRAGDLYEEAARFDDAVVARVMAAGPLFNSGRVAEAIALLRDTKDRLGSRAGRSFRDRLVVRLGFLYAFARRTDEAWSAAQEIGEETLDEISALGAEAHFLRAALHAQRAEPRLWRTHVERGLEIFERIAALPDNIRAAFGNAGMQALALGDIKAAQAYMSRAVELARGLNSEVDYESSGLAEVELCGGRLEAARALLDPAHSAVKLNARARRKLVTVALATLRGDGSDSVDLALLEEAARGGHDALTIKLATSYAGLLAANGREADAGPLLERATYLMTTTYDMAIPIATIVRLRPDLGAHLRPLVAAAAERPGDLVGRALAAYVTAALEGTAGTVAVARHAAQAAAAQFGELGWPILEALANEIAGNDDAARKTYRAIGAHAELRRLERSLASEDDGKRSETLLTPRERELARIIAEGKSNRSAAAALSVSEKAVEKYLTSIYAKLGMTSRSQLAAYVAITSLRGNPSRGD